MNTHFKGWFPLGIRSLFGLRTNIVPDSMIHGFSNTAQRRQGIRPVSPENTHLNHRSTESDLSISRRGSQNV
jgi:hypothetical protein